MSRAEPRICWLLETAARGDMRLYPDLDHADQPGRWVIGRLAVVADERGHGIGKTVLAEAERLIRRPVDMLPPYTPKIRISRCMNILATASPASFSTTVRMLASQGIELNPEEAAITCESVRHAVSGDGAYGIIDTWRKTSGFIAVPPWCNAAHGSLEPFVLVRVQVGELETGPRGEAGTQIHLIHIHQRHDERARSDCAM